MSNPVLVNPNDDEARSRASFSLHTFMQWATLKKLSGEYLQDTDLMRDVARRIENTANYIDKMRQYKGDNYNVNEFKQQVAMDVIYDTLNDKTKILMQKIFFDEKYENSLEDAIKKFDTNDYSVYFIYHKGYDAVKIGYSRNPSRRINQIRKRVLNTDLHFIALFNVGGRQQIAKDLEYFFHILFDKSRISWATEWFKKEQVTFFLNYLKSMYTIDYGVNDD